MHDAHGFSDRPDLAEVVAAHAEDRHAVVITTECTTRDRVCLRPRAHGYSVLRLGSCPWPGGMVASALGRRSALRFRPAGARAGEGRTLSLPVCSMGLGRRSPSSNLGGGATVSCNRCPGSSLG